MGGFRPRLRNGINSNGDHNMARRCPDCHTIVSDDRLGRCAACGSKLSGEAITRRWEQSMVTYILIALVIVAIVAAAWYFHLLPGQ